MKSKVLVKASDHLIASDRNKVSGWSGDPLVVVMNMFRKKCCWRQQFRKFWCALSSYFGSLKQISVEKNWFWYIWLLDISVHFMVFNKGMMFTQPEFFTFRNTWTSVRWQSGVTGTWWRKVKARAPSWCCQGSRRGTSLPVIGSRKSEWWMCSFLPQVGVSPHLQIAFSKGHATGWYSNIGFSLLITRQIVWEPIRKQAYTQLVREHSATVVSAHWATVDWSRPKEWN